MKRIFKVFVHFLDKSSQDYVTIHSAYSTLFMFISIFPLIMLTLSIISYLPIPEDYFLSIFYNILPETFHEMIYDIISGLYENASGFVLSISAIVALWSASAGVCGLIYGLNDVYRTYDTRPWIVQRLLGIIYTVVLIAIIAGSLLLLVFGNQLRNFIVLRIPSMTQIINFIFRLKYLFMFLIFMLFFTIIYYVFPHRKSRFFSHLPGAIFASGGWLLLSYVFSVYVDNVANFSMYGSLATIILFLFWLYISMCIIFLGGEVNAMIADHKASKEVNEYRRRHKENLKEIEAKRLAEGNKKLRPTERFVLQKSTTRRIVTSEIQKQIKKEEKERDYFADLEEYEKKKPKE